MMGKVIETVYNLRDVWFSYKTTPVLEEVTLLLERGKFYGLIGPNGSGKTTLLDLLAATARPTRGSVSLKNKPIATYPKKDLACLLALVPQDFTLGFDYTVFDIVLMGRHPHIPRFANPSEKDLALVDDALDIMDITNLRDRSVTDLSGGEKQRVVVARALAQDTEVIILDEATSNLDIRHTIEIMSIIHGRATRKEVTVIAAIHDLNLAASFCDELIVLKHGKVMATGPVTKVLTQELISRTFDVDSHVYLHPETQTPRVEYELKKCHD
jgi:ABC-type cobalamin/Fe3+-siderophores transport system ATPase subunit